MPYEMVWPLGYVYTGPAEYLVGPILGQLRPLSIRALLFVRALPLEVDKGLSTI